MVACSTILCNHGIDKLLLKTPFSIHDTVSTRTIQLDHLLTFLRHMFFYLICELHKVKHGFHHEKVLKRLSLIPRFHYVYDSMEKTIL